MPRTHISTPTSFDLTHLERLSTRSIHGSVQETEDSSSVHQESAITAALESQRILDFRADAATPTYARGETVAAAQNRMAETLHEFDLAFGIEARRARL